MTKLRLGVALGGGTARCYAHVGALKVLKEAGHCPDAVSGTSYGAFLAVLYALEPDAHALERWIEKQSVLELWELNVDFGLHRASLIAGERIERWLENLFRGATFADTRIPLHITCTDVDTGELVVLTEGSLAKAVRASCALPGLFATPVIEGRRLIDGGFVTPVPVTPLLRPDALTLGLHAGVDVEHTRFVRVLRWWHGTRVGEWWNTRLLGLPRKNVLDGLGKGLVRAALSYSEGLRLPEGCLLVRTAPPVAWWDFHRAAEAVEAGEGAMRRALPEVEARLEGVESERV